MKKFLIKIIFLLTIFYTDIQFANEIMIYADSISYDSEKNLIAKGNVKIINANEIITSDLIIYNNAQQKYILPKKFTFKDEKNNYYYGESGYFSKNLKEAQINEMKLRLNDGSRIVGKSSLRKGNIDIINKGTYSPCSSRININNFVCPIWQLEAEKILHDSDNLFLYQKHAKMRVFNIPVLYLPYFASPSPLRKKRKSGFLTPSVNFNFLDTKVSQSTSFPYYFNLDIDKELTLTPVFNYGGGINSSQRFLFDYNQLLSGGNLNFDLSLDTTLENENNESWLTDASIVTTIGKNINEKFQFSLNSAFQTSPTYLRRTDQNNFLNRKFEVNLSEIAIREKVGLLVYSPLASGYLSGKYRNGGMPKNSRMDLFYDFWPRYRTVNSEKAIEEYWNLAKNFNLNLTQMAIKFCEIRPFVTSVIIGATTLEQLKTNIDSVDINLNKELIEKIGEIQKKYPNPCP